MFDLGSISNLGSLTFIVAVRWTDGWEGEFLMLVDHLKHSPPTKSLKELTISIRIFRSRHGCEEFEGWKVLDLVISTLPSLERVVINLDFPLHPPLSYAYVIPAMRGLLPLSESRGILSIVTDDDTQLEEDMWPGR